MSDAPVAVPVDAFGLRPDESEIILGALFEGEHGSVRAHLALEARGKGDLISCLRDTRPLGGPLRVAESGAQHESAAPLARIPSPLPALNVNHPARDAT